MRVYSLKNCDTCKKALAWLVEQNISHEVHDIRVDGLNSEDVKKIIDAVGWEVALNRRSTTWRNLEDADKENVNAESAVRLITQHPTLLKRPVFVTEGSIVVGFAKHSQQQIEAVIRV